jgi:LysR family hydrogen peroxide-inducible transcriptional activator
MGLAGRFDMVSITQLEYILAVDQHRHFGRAAKAVHISQPTLSQQIQKLESDLGIIIFDRLHKPLIPTEEGRRFIDQAKTVIREHQRLLYLADNKNKGVAGKFRLGIIPTVAGQLLPLFLADFSHRYPQADLYIEELKTETIIEELINDHLDGAILATPLNKAGLKEHPLYYERFYLYLSENHPLLKKTALTADDLNGNEMWLLQDGHCFKSQVAHFCSIDGKTSSVFANIHFQSGSLDALKTIVKKNIGYTMIPAMMVATLPPLEIKKHVRPFKIPVPTREISFVYRRDHWKLDIIQAIEECVHRQLPDNVSSSKIRGENVLMYL